MKMNIAANFRISRMVLLAVILTGACCQDILSAQPLAIDPPGKQNIVVIIDPAHGGNDLGSVAPSGVQEKTITLAIANEIKKEGASSGIDFILTRELDQAKSAEERIRLGEKFSSALFISIHMNFDDDSLRSGIDLAFSDQNALIKKSELLGEDLLKQLGQLKGIRSNSMKSADFYILTHNPVPAVTLDLGYLSNKSDFDFINNPLNRTIVSRKIVSAIIDYSKR